MDYLSDICSLCLVNNQNIKSILSQDIDGIVVEEKLKVFLLELIHFKPNITKYICSNCLLNLNYMYKFRLKCLENITKLNQHLQKKLEVTQSDTNYEKEDTLELQNQNKSEEKDSPKTCLPDNVVIKTESIEYVFHENTNYIFMKENNQGYIPEDGKIDNEAHSSSLQNNVFVKQEHDNTFNQFGTPYQAFKEFNDEKYIDENTNSASISNKEPLHKKSFEDCDSGSDDEYFPSSDSSSSSETETNSSKLKATQMQIPVNSTIIESKEATSNVTICATDCMSTSNTTSKEENTHKYSEMGTNQVLSQPIHLPTSEKRCKCDVCGKGFNDTYRLTRHKLTHTGQKPFKCDICHKEFTQASSLGQHKRSHTGEKPYNCDVCGKSFGRTTHLIEHKRIHTGEKPYKCDICGRAFNLSNNLAHHKRSHTGEKPHKCDECGRAFARATHLVQHKKTHTGERSYKCEVCGKGLSTPTTLKIHQRTHTNEKPYKCDVCDKTFNHSISLINHRRVHTGEKPFKCDLCDRGFNQTFSLTLHKRTHTDVRPFKCNVCDKSFRHKSSLKQHKCVQSLHKCDMCGAEFSQIDQLETHKHEHIVENIKTEPV